MGFLDNVLKMFGGAAAAEGGSSAAVLTGALQQGLGSMDSGQLQGIGTHLLQAFTNTQSFTGDGAAAAAVAGTDAAAVESGSPDAIHALLALAQQHPEVVQNAVQGVMSNPQLSQQLLPLLGSILGKA
jgi:hypothetical protein